MTVLLDKAELPNGATAAREVCLHPGGVGVLPLDENGMVTLVRQYRYPFHELVLEIPAGKLDKGEDPLECGKRELEEETGFKAKEFISLGFLYPSPGFANEVTHLFFARGLYQGATNPDEDEFLDIEEVDIEKVREMIAQNKINDAKTVIAFLKCELLKLF